MKWLLYSIMLIPSLAFGSGIFNPGSGSGGSGGGGRPLEVFIGSTISSPTLSLSADPTQFTGTVSGSTFTFQANSSSFTLQGNSITFTGLQTQITATGVSTGAIQTTLGAVATSTASLQTQITATALTTGTINGIVSGHTTQITAIGVSTGNIQTSLNAVATSTASLQTQITATALTTGTINAVVSGHTTSITAIGVSTGNIQTSLNAVATSTASLQTQITATGVSTGTLRTVLDAVATSTATLSSSFPVSLSTNVVGILPVANGGTNTATPALVAGTNITSITGTWPNQTINAATQGGGGGGSPIAFTTGTATTYSNPAISSPLVVGIFNQSQFRLTATGTTGYFNIDTASITAQGNAIQLSTLNSSINTLNSQFPVSVSTNVMGTLLAAQEPAHTGDVTNTAGSLALAMASQISGAKTWTSSATFNNSLGVNVTYGVVAGSVSVTDDAYASTWDGSTLAPTKNAVYDKIQAVGTQITNVGVSTGNIQTSLNAVATSTASLQTQITAVGVSTGNIQTSLNAVATSTASLQTQIFNVGASTGNIRTVLDAVATSTATLSSKFPVSMSTSTMGILPVANGGTNTATPAIVAGTNITSITGTWPNQTINAATQGGGGAGYAIEPTTVPVQIAEGLYLATNTLTGTTYKITSTDTVVLAQSALASGGSVTYTLPIASAACNNVSGTGQVIQVTKVDTTTGTVIVKANGSDLLLGTTGLIVLNAIGQTAEFVSDCGTKWWPHGQGIQTTPAYTGWGTDGGSASTKISSTTYVCPMTVTVPLAVTGFTWYVQTAAAGSYANLGIYDSNLNLVVSTGPVLVGSFGFQTLTTNPVNLPPGQYYYAWQQQVAAVAISDQPGGGNGGNGNTVCSSKTGGPTLALPNPYVLGTGSAKPGPAINIRIAGGRTAL